MLRNLTLRLVIAAVLLVVGIGIGLYLMRPRLSEDRVRQAVLTTLVQEAGESFYVTGSLTFATAITLERSRVLLPGFLDLRVGSAETTVRVPGRVSYGFDVRTLRPEHIRFGADGVVEVDLPDLSIYAVEPQLEDVQMQTRQGWLRLSRAVTQEQEEEALRRIRPVMREQAERHLAGSRQPRVNTAEAMERLLTPVLQAAGAEEVRFRIRIGPELVRETPAE
jgi:hypothetical protein